MSINAKIKDAEDNYLTWERIVLDGAWSQHNRTRVQAVMLRERFESRLEAFQEAKLLMRVES